MYIVKEINHNETKENEFNTLISINKNGKLNYKKIVTSDVNLINNNIEEQLSQINIDSIDIFKYLNYDSSNNFTKLIKFTLNSFMHLKISVGDIKLPNDSIIELDLIIKNFDNLPVTIIFRKEQESYKIINITNLYKYLECIDNYIPNKSK